MEYTQLANGLKVSNITFGCWELGGGQWEKASDEVNLAVLAEALALGINSFDTAEGYGNGHSEEILGQALAGKRDQAIVATKVSPDHLAADDVRAAVERSLKRLGTDYLDIYYVHWPNAAIPLAETMRALRLLKDEGSIRAIGVSNFSLPQLKEAMAVVPVDVIQPEYSLLCRDIEEDVVPYCREHRIGILSYSSVAKGILTGAYHFGHGTVAASDFRANRRLFLSEHLEAAEPLVENIRTIARNHDVSMAQVAIAWLLAQPQMSSAIVGTQSVEHLRDNVRAVALRLTKDEIQSLDRQSMNALSTIDEV